MKTNKQKSGKWEGGFWLYHPAIGSTLNFEVKSKANNFFLN
jgi:hypothetical protein